MVRLIMLGSLIVLSAAAAIADPMKLEMVDPPGATSSQPPVTTQESSAVPAAGVPTNAPERDSHPQSESLSAPARAYVTYIERLRTVTHAAELAPLMTAERAKDLREPKIDEMLPMLRSMIPIDVKVVNEQIKDNKATLLVTGKMALGGGAAPSQSNGIVTMVRAGDKWLFETESWNLGAKEEVPKQHLQEIEWAQQAAKQQIPTSSPAGLIHGYPFKTETAVLQLSHHEHQPSTLTFADSANFNLFPSFGIQISLPEKAVTSRTYIASTESDQGVGFIQLYWTSKQNTSGLASETFTSGQGAGLKLELGAVQGSTVKGRVSLRLPDEKKSYVIGSFTAAVK